MLPCPVQRSYGDLRARSATGVVDLAAVDAFFGLFLPPALLPRLVTALDRGGSGAVDAGELTACVSVCCKGSIEERIAFAFRLFDVGHTGTMTPAAVRC